MVAKIVAKAGGGSPVAQAGGVRSQYFARTSVGRHLETVYGNRAASKLVAARETRAEGVYTADDKISSLRVGKSERARVIGFSPVTGSERVAAGGRI